MIALKQENYLGSLNHPKQYDGMNLRQKHKINFGSRPNHFSQKKIYNRVFTISESLKKDGTPSMISRSSLQLLVATLVW